MPPGALGDHLQGQMGYQKICCNPKMHNILLDRTWHSQHQHQGPRGTGYVPPGALGGTYRDIWADSMGLSDSEFLLDYMNFVISVL